jgi:hypothetical protein
MFYLLLRSLGEIAKHKTIRSLLGSTNGARINALPILRYRKNMYLSDGLIIQKAPLSQQINEGRFSHFLSGQGIVSDR